ncbi:GABA transporter 1-like [Chlorella sorokiniana]|uniref:GABA transporter 1-like n=1 Tax=Chlorella sorokiniana TaxID=3076 RepID=A0A2P6TDG2_CHLSO|nr:GABA transporter 1-like [Chlorella sorokiniana]|eukprot:PRW20662.1 GABA transporter 1-like [Chlorella sorokiniana]
MPRLPEDSAHGGSESFKVPPAASLVKGGDASFKAGSLTESFEGTDVERETSREFQGKESFRSDVGAGTWLHAGYHLATTIATPAAYAYLPFAFAGLSWGPGLVALLIGIATTWYASVLLASLHEWNGVRYLRYSDLAASISGPWAGRAVIFFQQIASLGNNVTLGIVAGISMKALNRSFDPDSTMTLQQWIVIFGCIQLVLCQFPSIHDLRVLNLACTICTCGFAATATALSIYSGCNRPAGDPPVSYDVVGSTSGIVFGVFSSLGTVAFAFGDTVLPEIQATLKAPVKRNMHRAVAMCYSIISASYLIVTITGYWAFGNAVKPYLPASFGGPTWANRLVEFFALIQIAGCYQIYVRPTLEAVELKTMDTTQPLTSRRNLLTRFVISTIYVAVVTLIGCALPFFGDFLALCGAIGFTPLDFCLPMLLYNTAFKGAVGRLRRWAHTAGAYFFALVGVVAAIGAVRWIIVDSVNFNLFADL